MRKLILECGLSPGDIVMLTAAVRDLHFWHPGEFLTDVRTSAPALWENNPYLHPLSESDAGVEVLDCRYPLINYANHSPYHCLHGFVEFLNQVPAIAFELGRCKAWHVLKQNCRRGDLLDELERGREHVALVLIAKLLSGN